jgi:hypothetical protein
VPKVSRYLRITPEYPGERNVHHDRSECAASRGINPNYLNGNGGASQVQALSVTKLRHTFTASGKVSPVIPGLGSCLRGGQYPRASVDQ